MAASVAHHQTRYTSDLTELLQVKTGSGPGFLPQGEVSVSTPEKVNLVLLPQGTWF